MLLPEIVGVWKGERQSWESEAGTGGGRENLESDWDLTGAEAERNGPDRKRKNESKIEIPNPAIGRGEIMLMMSNGLT